MIHAQSEKSWPGAPPLGKVVVVEDLKYFEPGTLQIGSGGYCGRAAAACGRWAACSNSPKSS